MSTKVQKVMVQPITVIFKHFQSKQRVTIWLFDSQSMRLEGTIIGFDEFMNIVLDDAQEVHYKKGTRQETHRRVIGRAMLRGENITVIEAVQA
ncbi:putative small nuclear ribonucleo protein E [Catenaria anguillulae PL171]|uniref:Small nuclear ribonucleoprotein E n=1 Tax=Catenaria anguillulae PL171 TaxID=765915 RepID=A0A1Y2H9G1_9FUNG|nr:putative small nuclear ribonucleo protein E [Catenaria anguillulae PL171]